MSFFSLSTKSFFIFPLTYFNISSLVIGARFLNICCKLSILSLFGLLNIISFRLLKLR